jgi:hypothetical protein
MGRFVCTKWWHDRLALHLGDRRIKTSSRRKGRRVGLSLQVPLCSSSQLAMASRAEKTTIQTAWLHQLHLYVALPHTCRFHGGDEPWMQRMAKYPVFPAGLFTCNAAMKGHGRVQCAVRGSIDYCLHLDRAPPPLGHLRSWLCATSRRDLRSGNSLGRAISEPWLSVHGLRRSGSQKKAITGRR